MDFIEIIQYIDERKKLKNNLRKEGYSDIEIQEALSCVSERRKEETQRYLERLKNYQVPFYTAILERYKILPLISTISAVLVGLVIQETDLVKMEGLAFVSFVILLFVIPFSIFGILYQLGRDCEHLAERIKNLSQQTTSLEETSSFINIFPWITYIIFSTAIMLFILSFFNLA